MEKNVIEQLGKISSKEKVTFEEIKKIIKVLATQNSADPAVTQRLVTLEKEMGEIEKELKEGQSNSFDILPLSVRDLSETYKLLEKAAVSILDSTEVILKTPGIDEKLKATVMQICEHCNFHDLAGQRIMRVMQNLEKFENTTLSLLSFILGIKINKPGDYVQKDSLLNGPALEGTGQSQADVDKLFK